jgi:hypothetical protein
VIHVDRASTQTFDVDLSRIKVDGALEGYKVFVDDKESKTVSVTLQGLESAINQISDNDITGTVSVQNILDSNNLQELSAGTYSADVTFDLPDLVKVKGTVSVDVTVEKDN